MDRPRPSTIRSRSFAYALRAVRLYQYLQERKDGAGWILGKQYLRAATSVGANIEEAQAGESRADFVHKLGVAQKEAKESLYRLRLMAESGLVPKRRLAPLAAETEEIIAIITRIVVTSKKRTGSDNSQLLTARDSKLIT